MSGRIPLHDHSGPNSGGPVQGAMVVYAAGLTVDGGGSSGGTAGYGTPVATGTALSTGSSSQGAASDHVHTNSYLGTVAVTGTAQNGYILTASSAGAATWAAAGTSVAAIIVENGGTVMGTATILNFANGTATYSGGTATYTAPAGSGGGVSYGQVLSYPTSFTGDTINGSSTTPFADVAAFDTKEVLNSRILHLQTQGASKDQRVRVTLGTTKAGAFDVVVVIQAHNSWWSSFFDTYTEVRLSTSADGQLAIARIGAVYPHPETNVSSGSPFPYTQAVRVGGTAISGADDTQEPKLPMASTITLRFKRDGSNVITYWIGRGQAPMALNQIVNKGTGTYGAAYTQTVSGTLARIEIAHHSPSGPGSTDQIDTWLDYLASY